MSKKKVETKGVESDVDYYLESCNRLLPCEVQGHNYHAMAAVHQTAYLLGGGRGPDIQVPPEKAFCTRCGSVIKLEMP